MPFETDESNIGDFESIFLLRFPEHTASIVTSDGNGGLLEVQAKHH